MTTALIHTGGTRVVAALQRHGVRVVFGIPGTHNLEIYRGLGRTEQIRTITTRHEQGAAYAADAYAKVTGEAGVVVTTSGPGVLNSLVGIGTSYAESRPVVLIAPGPPRRSPGVHDIGELHEMKDVFGAVTALTKWSIRVETVDEIDQAIDDAFAHALGGRRRPVFIEVPIDVLESEASAPFEHPSAESAVAEMQGAAIQDAADRLNRATLPVFVLGGGSVGAASSIAQVVSRIGAAVVTTTNGKGVFPESHPYSLGSTISSSECKTAIAESDCVVVIGSELGESDLGPDLIVAKQLIRIDIDEHQLQLNTEASLTILGDSALILPQLAALLQEAPAGRSNAVEAFVQRVRTAVDAEVASPMLDLASAVGSSLVPGSIVTADSSQIVYLGAAFVRMSEQPDSFVYMARSATLGYALPAALGAKAARPDRQVVALVGDGAFLFSCQELATAHQEGLHVTVVLIDNSGYGEIAAQQIDRQIELLGVELVSPDFVQLGRAFGLEAKAVESLAELQFEIQTAANVRKSTVLVYRPPVES